MSLARFMEIGLMDNLTVWEKRLFLTELLTTVDGLREKPEAMESKFYPTELSLRVSGKNLNF